MRDMGSLGHTMHGMSSLGHTMHDMGSLGHTVHDVGSLGHTMHDMGSLGHTMQMDLPRDWVNRALNRDVVSFRFSPFLFRLLLGFAFFVLVVGWGHAFRREAFWCCYYTGKTPFQVFVLWTVWDLFLNAPFDDGIDPGIDETGRVFAPNTF